MVPTNMGSLQSLNMDAMIKYTFLPDYSVRAVTDVLYMRVRRSLYLAAKRATLMERSQKDSTGQDQFDAEMEKVIKHHHFSYKFNIVAYCSTSKQFISSLDHFLHDPNLVLKIMSYFGL